MYKSRYKGFDYEACNHPNLPPKPEPTPVVELEWVHAGGGYYDNTVTGERRFGRPEED